MINLSKEEFLKKASVFYEKMDNQMDDKRQDFYDYERTLDELVLEFSKELLESSLGSVPENKRKKKKLQTRFGKIAIKAAHRYSESVNGYRISPYLQERMTFLGQQEIYAKSSEVLGLFLGIKVNDMQVHRVTNTYGELSKDLVGEEQSRSLKGEVKKEEVVYVQADGAMVLTREEQWQEVKLGRIFSGGDLVEYSEKDAGIRKSLYKAHLGSSEDFIKEFAPMVDVFDKLGSDLVFITDGAVWLRNWISGDYPKATQILDFMHGVGHISDWLKIAEKDESKRQAELGVHKEMLLEQGVKPVIERIKATTCTHKTHKSERKKLLTYLKNNTHRMDYPTYLKRGLCIGSGAIEAGHRTIMQVRMKRSGQRWTQARVQNMLNLRTAHASGQWSKVVSIMRNPKAA